MNPLASKTTPSSATGSPDSRPRLMLFTDSFRHGGTEGQFVKAVRLLHRDKYDVTVGCLQRQGPLLDQITALGFPLVEFPLNSLHNLRTAGLFARLIRYLRKNQIDLLHAFDFYTTVFAVPAARLAGVPVVLASRRELAQLRGTWQRRAFTMACRMATRVVVNSRAAQASLQNGHISHGRFVIVHNCVNLEALRPGVAAQEVRRRLGIPETAPVAGLTANLRPEKDIATFVRAAAQVNAALPEARFVVIGEGAERPALESLAGELGMREKIFFVGDRRDVGDLVNALDVFVLCSRSESFPNVILEAMALGLPVVATNVGGVPELVENGASGCLVPPGDPAAIAQRLLELFRNSEMRRGMGEAGRLRVEREFTPLHMRQKLEHLYDSLLAEKKVAAGERHTG